MAEKIQAVRGMNDILPEQSSRWQALEKTLIQCMSQYGYQEIRFPIVESTQLFKRSIGEVTDIVEKEMYTFNDLNGESLTLRPEGTAGCLRACLEHGLLHNQQQKLWYLGPMFRHEKPQRGRYRQFFHFGVEAYGMAGCPIELEIIALCQRMWKLLGLDEYVHLQINTLGELSERQAYKKILVDYFTSNSEKLDEDSQRRLHKNPLRILDSKNPDMQTLLAEAPKLIDSLGENSTKHFSGLCQGLEQLGIPYVFNPQLVRGLDYYGHTVFEWVTDKLGSQATVCGGGRYDALVEQLGGNPVPAFGMAMGLERLLLLQEEVNSAISVTQPPTLFVMASGAQELQKALQIAETLRNFDPKWCVISNTVGGSFKSQFKKADKSGAHFALIIGENELKDEVISLKNLRIQGDQVTIPQQQLCQYLSRIMTGVK